MLNWNLMGNPVNWLIVYLMIAIGVIGLYTVSKAGAFGTSFGSSS